MSNRKLSTVLLDSPEAATNQPKLLALSGTIQPPPKPRRTHPLTWWLLGVVAGVLLTLAWDLWRVVEVAR